VSRPVVADPERGAAVAEFALISVLLVMLLFGVLQVAVLFYVRNIAAASASDGARYAGGADVAGPEGARRASALLRTTLAPSVARDLPCEARQDTDAGSGLPIAVVRCRGRLHSIFLPIGALVRIDVTGRALEEGAP
jgi:hypothetical protein